MAGETLTYTKLMNDFKGITSKDKGGYIVTHKSKERRKEKYDLLRSVGYTSREANRYKDFCDSKIEELVKARRNCTKIEAEIVGSK